MSYIWDGAPSCPNHKEKGISHVSFCPFKNVFLTNLLLGLGKIIIKMRQKNVNYFLYIRNINYLLKIKNLLNEKKRYYFFFDNPIAALF